MFPRTRNPSSRLRCLPRVARRRSAIVLTLTSSIVFRMSLSSYCSYRHDFVYIMHLFLFHHSYTRYG